MQEVIIIMVFGDVLPSIAGERQNGVRVGVPKKRPRSVERWIWTTGGAKEELVCDSTLDTKT